MEEIRSWQDDAVDFIPRQSQQELQNGHLKEDGSEVRKCDGCYEWKLLEEFPKKTKHFAIWFCNTCHGFPSKPQKRKKGEKFAQYNEYVIKCGDFKMELLNLRVAYQTDCRRLKAKDFAIREQHRIECKAECRAVEEEMARIRDEYTDRKNAVLGRRREVVEEYRKTLPEKFQ